MPTAAEVHVVAPVTATHTSNRLGRLLRKRLAQLSRIASVLAIGFGLAITVLTVWWLTSLNGLPGIGDPFDVAAIRGFQHPQP